MTTLDKFFTWLAAREVTALRAITAPHVRDYLAELMTQGYASATQRTAARAVKRFLRFCEREGYLTVSPMAHMKLPKEDKKLPSVLSDDEVERLFAACKTTRERALVAVFLDAGLRVAEVAGLTWGAVNLDSGQIFVKQGKGRKDRVVFVGAKTRRVLGKLYLLQHKPDVARPVFLSLLRDEGLTVTGVQQLLAAIGKRASIPGHLGPHKLRRTFATLSLRSGMDLHTLARAMGHEDTRVLERYLLIADEDVKRAAERHGVVDRFDVGKDKRKR